MNLKITDNTCRICLLSNEKVDNIFAISHYDHYNGLKLEFKQKLEIHCGIEIEENDGLPNKICVECIEKINTAHNLWKQCQITDNKLREFYNKTAEKVVTCITLKNKFSQTGDSLTTAVVGEVVDREKKLYYTQTLSSLKESIAFNKLQHEKNNPAYKGNDEKINNINKIELEDKPQLYDLKNLNTKEPIHNKYSPKFVNSSCATEQLSFKSLINNNICKKIKTEDRVNYFPINDDVEIKSINNNSDEFVIIQSTNEGITPFEHEINYIIENDHCYTSVVKSEEDTLSKKLQPIIIHNDDFSNSTLKKSTNTNQSQCYVCGKKYIQKSALHKHMKHHMKLFREKGFECQICKKKLGSNASLKLHCITHQGEKPYKCKYCGHGFLTESKRVYHERSHTLERPYVCDLCDATYPQMHLLKLHITKHTGENKYLCEKCGKSFRMYKCLKEHQFTHTKEKPFICNNNCGMAYSNSGSLFAHKKRCTTKTQPLIS